MSDGSYKLAETQAYIDGLIVAHLILEFHKEFRDIYPSHVLTSSLCAVGPLQAMFGLAIREGFLAITDASSVKKLYGTGT